MNIRTRIYILLSVISLVVLLFYIANNANNDNRVRRLNKEVRGIIKIYTKYGCDYCSKAKAYLREKKMPFEETDISLNPTLHQDLIQKTGSRTVPYIFVNETYIGGYVDMLKMSDDGRLADLLSDPPRRF